MIDFNSPGADWFYKEKIAFIVILFAAIFIFYLLGFKDGQKSVHKHAIQSGAGRYVVNPTNQISNFEFKNNK
jgi:hypothetical protein